MKMILKLSALTLCVVLGLISGTRAEEPIVTGNAVDLVSSDGLHVEFPYYPSITSLGSAYRESTVFHVLETLKYIKEVVGKSLMSQRVSRFGWAGVTAKLIKMGNDSKNARKNLEKGFETGGKFNAEMKEMFSEMMAESKVIEKTLAPEDPLTLKEEMDTILNALMEAVEASPVASYFKWSDGKINGKSFIKVSAEYMARLSKQGYGPFLNCISALLCLIVKLSSIG